MAEILHINTDKARLAPETVFARPLDVVAEVGLTRGQKISALERWRNSLLDRIRSTEEGMQPPAGQTADESATVHEIAEALEFLNGKLVRA